MQSQLFKPIHFTPIMGLENLNIFWKSFQILSNFQIKSFYWLGGKSFKLLFYFCLQFFFCLYFTFFWGKFWQCCDNIDIFCILLLVSWTTLWQTDKFFRVYWFWLKPWSCVRTVFFQVCGPILLVRYPPCAYSIAG